MMGEGLAVDPAARMTMRIALALLFAWAAAHKLRDVAAFRDALANYRILPAVLVDIASIGLIVCELLVAAGLIGSSGSMPAVVAAMLLMLYASAIAINLVRGRRQIDCGCAGPASRRAINGALIARNGILLLVAVIAACPAAARELVWIDVITITGGVAALGLLYTTLDALIANSPALQALKPSSPQTLAGQLGSG